MELPFKKTSHVKVIEIIAQGMSRAGNLDNYLELGSRAGTCFNLISPLAKTAYAVEIRKEFFADIDKSKGNVKEFLMSTDDFFKAIDKNIKFDLVFIDANHHHESSLKDFKNVWKMVREGGIICMHDTYPPNEEFIKDHCHDCYKTAVHVRKYYSKKCEIVTLPFFYGVSIIRKVMDNHLIWKK